MARDVKSFLADKAAQAKAKQSKTTSLSSTLPLDKILPRDSDTRSLNEDHVIALSESISAVGLIQPIVIDIQGRLLAGGHRKAAIDLLHTSDLKAFNKWFSAGIPVHQFDFDAQDKPDLALAIEATENEKRRDYTPAEVKELAEKLREAGYSDLKGRPKDGQKSVVLALSTIIGKSNKTVRRYLTASESRKGGHVSTFSEVKSSTARSLKKLIGCDDIPEDIEKLAIRMLKKLDE
ncbi:ParB N-terminal domain-containing protein [Acaryochloris marina NIES-2412]|uniref:ParB/RepB/Spo0J family partition protein n=1 Tax=Acaryochloris marina TaxID=155978 RepID=UPI00405A41D4